MKAIQDEWSHLPTASARWKARNPEYAKKRYQSDPERFIKDTNKWQEDNPNKVKKYKHKYKVNNKVRGMFHAAKQRALKQGVPFDLEFDDIIIPEYCPILGIKLQHNDGKVSNASPSIDKIIPSLGYTKNNIRVISYAANRYKSNLTREQLQKFLDYIDGKI